MGRIITEATSDSDIDILVEFEGSIGWDFFRPSGFSGTKTREESGSGHSNGAKTKDERQGIERGRIPMSSRS
jgi:hypothetical protein